MPDIDRTADIKITAAQGTVTAEIPLAGHASEHWLVLFRKLASQHFSGTAPSADAAEREGRTWVIVRLLADYPARGTESMLDTVSAVIGEANGMEQQVQSGVAQTEAAIRSWWARQQR
jgi:hypothetical protein